MKVIVDPVPSRKKSSIGSGDGPVNGPKTHRSAENRRNRAKRTCLPGHIPATALQRVARGWRVPRRRTVSGRKESRQKLLALAASLAFDECATQKPRST